VKATLDELPEQLPEVPKGWTRTFRVHFNFGGGKGQSEYSIQDPSGKEMPFGYVSSSKSGSGFFLPGVEPLMSWNELREIWPRWMERARAKVAQRDLNFAESGK